jgi:Protein of unknown function (DUF3099)
MPVPGRVARGARAAYREDVRTRPRPRDARAHLITQARTSRSADIKYRERRYLLMMGIRVVCFLIAIVMFVNHAGWLTAIPAVGAIIIPYFAVVLANGGREPDAMRGFREYKPSLPERWTPPGSNGEPGGGQQDRGPRRPPDGSAPR